MKKRIGTLILAMFFVLALVGCANSSVKDVINQGKEALQNKEYDKALASFDLALEKEPKNEEVITLKNIIGGYLKAKEYLQQGKVEEAQKSLEGINSKYNEYSIKDDINKLKEDIKKAVQDNKAIDDEIVKLNALYNNQKYDDAKELILELNKNKLNDKQKEAINSISNKISNEGKNTETNNSINNSSESNKTAEKNTNTKITQNMQNTQGTQKAVFKNQKQLYINKLNKVKAELTDLEGKYSNGTTVEMRQAAKEEYRRWDNALNEIYSTLEKQVSPSDMRQLKAKQRQWIAYRDNKAKKDSLQFKGGSMEGLSYTSSLGQLTKDRCYELVEKYMK